MPRLVNLEFSITFRLGYNKCYNSVNGTYSLFYDFQNYFEQKLSRVAGAWVTSVGAATQYLKDLLMPVLNV